MLKLELENKKGGKPTAADRLHKTDRRIGEIEAELAELGMQAQRTERELSYAEPEEGAALETERSRIAGQRAKLEQERSTLEATLPEIRAAVGREEWVVETTKQEYLKRQFEEAARDLVEKATALADSFQKIEAVWHDNEDLSRRLVTRAQRYGRAPLAPLVPAFAHQLPGSFLDAVQQVAERVQSLEADRQRDPLLYTPPTVPRERYPRGHWVVGGEPVEALPEPEETAVSRGPRGFFRGFLSGDAA